MTSVTSANERQKIYQLENERALVARQLNLAKGRQALTIKKLKNQGFEVSPVVPPQDQEQVEIASPPPIEESINEELEVPSLYASFRNIGLAALSALITNLVVDYAYPRLRAYVVPHPPNESSEDVREDMWGNQSIFK